MKTYEEFYTALTDSIKAAMAKSGISQTELADIISTKDSALSRILNTIHNPTLETIYKIFSSLNIELFGTLILGDEKPLTGPITIGEIVYVHNQVTNIMIKKSEDYGTAALDLGQPAILVMLWTKINRFRNLIESQKGQPNFESIDDTLTDIIGWATIGKILREREK